MVDCIVSFSGGMDSATLLALAVSQGKKPLAIGFKYQSKHNFYELEAAARFVGHCGVDYRIIDLTHVFVHFKSDLLLSGGLIPEGHYEHESMKRTVVPGRNLIFASILAGLAESEAAREVWLGVHAGDHAIYPDCRPEFVLRLADTVQTSTEGKVWIKTPFLHMTKWGILQAGLTLKVPYQLTRTCYCDKPIACGRCGSCTERLEAFRENGVEDPLEYESRVILPKE